MRETIFFLLFKIDKTTKQQTIEIRKLDKQFRLISNYEKKIIYNNDISYFITHMSIMFASYSLLIWDKD